MLPGLVSRAFGLCAALTVTLGLVWAPPAAAQCGGTQLCAPAAPGVDCTVAADCTITVPAAGLTIDLGARRLVLTKTLTVTGPEGAGLTVNVGNLLINGGTIVAPGANSIAGNVTIQSATGVTVQGNGLIDVSAGLQAGSVELDALGGDISFAGRINAGGASTRQGGGGDVTLFATGSVTMSGSTIDVSGGDMAFGGSITVDALNGGVVVGNPLKALGGDGGDIELSAGTTLQTSSSAVLNVNANGDAGSGGSVDISAFGDLTIGGETIGTGAASDFREEGRTGGDGADFDVFSDTGTVQVNGKVDVTGAPGGSGGVVDIFAGQNLTFTKQLVAQSDGIDGLGGDVFLTVGGALTLSQLVDVRGNLGTGGSIDAIAVGNLTVSALLNANGELEGGTISLAGCAVNVTSQGQLSAEGPGGLPLGSNVIQAGSTMTINGTLKATSQNLLQVRALPLPSVTGTNTPAATREVNPLIPCCVGCPVTTTTTTSTTILATTTSSTTTTSRPTTTSSTSSTTTTSSTTSSTTTSSTSTTTSTTTTTTSTTTSSTTTTTTSTTTSSTSTTTSTTTTSSSTTTTVAGGCTAGGPAACGACETCDPVNGCVAALRTSCRLPVVPLKAPLKLKDAVKGPASDQFMWKWDNGASTELADFGNPTTTDGYALCVFDRSQASPSLLFRAAAAPGGNCGTAAKPKNCWVGNGKNFKFTRKVGNGDGVVGIVLTPGAGGKAKAQVKAKGLNLTGRPFGLPAPPLNLPLTVQLQSANGRCWEANYSAAGVKKNAGEKFEAKAD